MSGFLQCGGTAIAGVTSNTMVVAVAANAVAPLEEIGKAFAARRGTGVTLSSGATGLLARQLREGAPFDVFVSADVETLQRLGQQGLITSGSVCNYARGELVLWQREDVAFRLDSVDSLASAPVSFRVAIANAEAAPYGRAAKQVLERLGLWSKMDGRVILAENVGTAMQMAKSGNVDAAFVAGSSVVGLKAVVVPEGRYDPIVQAAGVVAGSKHVQDGEEFCRFLCGNDGQQILRKYGYKEPR